MIALAWVEPDFAVHHFAPRNAMTTAHLVQTMPASREDAGALLEANTLLAPLPAEERARLLESLDAVELPLELAVYGAHEPIEHLFFPSRGIISIVADLDRGTVEVGTVGCEGMVGLPVLLREDSTPTRAFVQVAGAGLRMPAGALRRCMAENPAFEQRLFRYAKHFLDEVMQSVACNRHHSLEERCARWLLMCHDRVGDQPIALRQSFLAEMLGVHRPSVTLAAGALQRAGFIRYTRGKITILDRAGLESASCPCYGVSARGHARLRERSGA